jgi:4-hydroxybenzoate polyprenyltransferase
MSSDKRHLQAGALPLDLALLGAAIFSVLAVGVWYTIQSDSLVWILFAVAFGVAAYFVTMPTRRRRRVDADGRHRQVGHDSSWTSGREDDD